MALTFARPDASVEVPIPATSHVACAWRTSGCAPYHADALKQCESILIQEAVLTLRVAKQTQTPSAVDWSSTVWGH